MGMQCNVYVYGIREIQNISRTTFADISGSIEKKCWHGTCKKRQNVTFTIFKMYFLFKKNKQLFGKILIYFKIIT